MLISLRHKLAFLAIPKTASTAIEAVLEPHCDIRFGRNPRAKHMSVRKFERFQRPYLKSIGYGDVETLCMFREPISWLTSWYSYRCRKQLQGSEKYCGHISFDQFIDAYLSDTRPDFAKIGNQSSFVLMGEDEVTVRHIFAYERIEEAHTFLSSRFDKLPAFPRVNISPAMTPALSVKNRERLHEALQTDFELHERILSGEFQS